MCGRVGQKSRHHVNDTLPLPPDPLSLDAAQTQDSRLEDTDACPSDLEQREQELRVFRRVVWGNGTLLVVRMWTDPSALPHWVPLPSFGRHGVTATNSSHGVVTHHMDGEGNGGEPPPAGSPVGGGAAAAAGAPQAAADGVEGVGGDGQVQNADQPSDTEEEICSVCGAGTTDELGPPLRCVGIAGADGDRCPTCDGEAYRHIGCWGSVALPRCAGCRALSSSGANTDLRQQVDQLRKELERLQLENAALRATTSAREHHRIVSVTASHRMPKVDKGFVSYMDYREVAMCRLPGKVKVVFEAHTLLMDWNSRRPSGVTFSRYLIDRLDPLLSQLEATVMCVFDGAPNPWKAKFVPSSAEWNTSHNSPSSS
ncbi:unnamed protein product [Vitrella brassicaformis CCMP3155]|uniref:Uncharacterized protein n=1 Tax=Vitrella brassicaformis (strain CCMP3155) TaxID=1169540 RepID=A0A0G4GCX9_VITBC|nr:unnamed protein product [Vitrella brassicaformis CCMP3155]|eukprot:CEM27140.1 unnamed protein product [Vitrella brassicaformis CCMP3155]